MIHILNVETEKRWRELAGKSKSMYQMAIELYPIGKEKYGLKTLRETYDLIVEKFGRDDKSWPKKKIGLDRKLLQVVRFFHNIPFPPIARETEKIIPHHL